MHYVGNNHVAFDTCSLGFPSIEACQAVCFQVNGGLYGFHDYKGAGGTTVDALKAKAFAKWVKKNSEADIETGAALYGIINQTHQYTRDAAGVLEWKTMLLSIAQKLKFEGPVYGARITSNVGKSDSLYVRFDLIQNHVQISYKRWSKMEKDKNAIPLNPDNQALVRPAKSTEVDPKKIGALSRPYKTEPLKDYEYEDVFPVRRKDPKKSENLHVIASKKIMTFR